MNKSVQAQALYLANLLALPGLSFLLLAFLYYKLVWQGEQQIIRDALDLNLDDCKDLKQQRGIESSISQQELDQSHARAAFWLSVIGGSLVLGGCSSILAHCRVSGMVLYTAAPRIFAVFQKP